MNIYRSFAALTTAFMSIVISCEKPGPAEPEPQEQIKPVFPGLVEDNDVAPGSVLSLSFEANMDWEVSVPSENLQWFWINDNSFKVDKLSGKVAEGEKQKVSVQIGVSDIEEFDTNRSCEVTLSMGGESKVIAKYMRPAKEMTLAVYAAKVEGGVFVLNSAGGYEYEQAEASSLDMIWSSEDAGFIIPVKVEANCEWTADVPEWVDLQIDGSTVGMVETVLRGSSAEAASGKISFNAGGKALKDIDVSMPACGEVHVYPVQLDDNGEFMFAEDGGYLYSANPADAVTLVWPGNDYRLPVKVDSKCDWTLELPEWLLVRYSGDTPESNAGVVTMNLMGDPKHYPLEDETGSMLFKYDGKTVHEISVTIPGCAGRFSFGLDMALTSWEFNAGGKLMTPTGYQDLHASAWFVGTEKASVVAVEMKDGKKVKADPDWLTLDVQAYVQGEDVLQQRTVTLMPSVNEGDERSAYVLFMDGGSVDDFFGSDGTLKPDKAAYAVSLIQHASDVDYVSMVASESEMAAAGATFTVSENPRLEAYFGETKYRYELVYDNVYARDKAFMTFAKPYSSYKVFNAGQKDMTSSDDFWLKFTAGDEERTSGVIDMYSDMTPPKKEITGYVVFYGDSGETLAIIQCVYSPSASSEPSFTVEFTELSATYAEAAGASLEHLTSGELFEFFSDGISPVYHLTYSMEGMPLRIRIPDSVKKHTVNPYGYKNFFRVNDVIYDEFFGSEDLLGEVETDDEGSVEIYMDRPETVASLGNNAPKLPENAYRAVINFHDRSDGMIFILVCTLDLSGN